MPRLIDLDTCWLIQSLRCAADVLAVTAVHALVYEIASLKERPDIFVDGRKNRIDGDGRSSNTRIDCRCEWQHSRELNFG